MIFVYLLLTILSDSLFHYWLIEKKGIVPNHPLSAAYRILIAILFYYFFDKTGNLVYYLFAAFFANWLFFNLFLNKWRGETIGYVGKKAVLDRVEAWLSKDHVVRVGMKLMFFILFVKLYYR